MPVMNFDLEDGKPPVTFTLREADTVRFMAFMAECDRALNGRAAKPAVPDDLVELLRELRPNYGDVGSRDVDVTEKQRKIDAAIALLSAAPPLPVAQGAALTDIAAPKEPT
jgi:hypothetical protein